MRNELRLLIIIKLMGLIIKLAPKGTKEGQLVIRKIYEYLEEAQEYYNKK